MPRIYHPAPLSFLDAIREHEADVASHPEWPHDDVQFNLEFWLNSVRPEDQVAVEAFREENRKDTTMESDIKVDAAFEAWLQLDETQREMLNRMTAGYVRGQATAVPVAEPPRKRGRPVGSKRARKALGSGLAEAQATGA